MDKVELHSSQMFTQFTNVIYHVRGAGPISVIVPNYATQCCCEDLSAGIVQGWCMVCVEAV